MRFSGVTRPFTERPDEWMEAQEALQRYAQCVETPHVRFASHSDTEAMNRQFGGVRGVHARLRSDLSTETRGILPVVFSEVNLQDNDLRVVFADTGPLEELRRYLYVGLLGHREPLRSFSYGMRLGVVSESGDRTQALKLANGLLRNLATTLDWVHVAGDSTEHEHPTAALGPEVPGPDQQRNSLEVQVLQALSGDRPFTPDRIAQIIGRPVGNVAAALRALTRSGEAIKADVHLGTQRYQRPTPAKTD